MVRTGLLTALAGLVLGAAAAGQELPWRFNWRPGQVLTYHVEQTTSASEVVDGKTAETKSKLTNTKRWQVLSVDVTGVATVQMSLAALRMENTTSTGETLVFDSSAPEKSTPQLQEQLSKYVGQPLAVLRVDSRGKVVEVKESKNGSASRYESDPPFGLILPETAVQAGPSWERAYDITLDPPQGTGEKWGASQKYVCQNLQDGKATIALATKLTTAPASASEQVPLLQMQPEGTILFDTKAGRVVKVELHIAKVLNGQQGEGSSYRFQSSYREEYAGDR